MRRKWGLVVFLCLVVALGSVRLVSSTGSNGVPTSFYNCGTSEPTINSNTINVIVCDDFERSRTAANVVTTGPPGTWYVTNCDNPAGVGGESNPPNKGWCGNIFNAVHADSGVTTPGVNSTAYAAYSNPNNGADNLGSHNFQTTCQAPSVLNVNCRITGASNTQRTMTRSTCGFMPSTSRSTLVPAKTSSSWISTDAARGPGVLTFWDLARAPTVTMTAISLRVLPRIVIRSTHTGIPRTL